MDRANEKRMTVFCDGAAEPTNPGPMGAGYVLQDAAGEQIEARGRYLGCGSNNIAEYQGIIDGIEAAIRHGATRLEVRSDSQLAVKQILGFWTIKAEHLRSYREKVVALLSRISHWDLEWIPRDRNTQADVLANNAAMFKRDLDYTGREILPNAHKERVMGATR